MATADTAKMVAELGLRDKMSPGLDKAIAKIGKLETRVDRLGSHVQRGLGNAARNTERAVVLGIGGAVAGLTYAVKQATDAESAIAGVSKTVEGDITGIVDGLKTLSNTIPVSFGELAGIAELGGAMGVAKKDLVEFTKQVAILGTTTNVSIEDAATALGQMKSVIGLTGDEFDNFAASLVDLGNKGSSTEAQILEIARRSGGAAKLIGIAKDETLGWAAAAANLGLNEELAGTAVQNFFLKTQTAITAGGADLRELAKISGKTTKQFKKDFDKNATGALTGFLKGLGKMSKDARLKAIQNIFGKGSGLTRLIVGLSDSFDKNLIPSLETSTDAWKDATAAQAEADKRFATSASSFKILRNNIDNAAATIGANLLPVLVELSKEATTFLADPKTQANIKAFGKDLATGARDAVKWLKSLDWDAIGNSLKTAASFGKGLVDAFVAAPPWLQQFLTVGFVANKFTGGAIGSIIGELGKGLVKGVLGMNAGVVNINAGVVNGGGLPGGGAPTGMGAAAKVVAGGIIVGGVALSLDSINQLAQANAVAADKGLSQGELAAVRYYQSSAADQAFMAKHIGYIPTKADFASGMSKLSGAADRTTTSVEKARAAGVASTTSAAQKQARSIDKTNSAIEILRRGTGAAISQSAAKAAAATRVEGERSRGLIGQKLDIVKTSTIEAGVKAKNASMETKAQVASSAGIQQALLLAQMATTRVTASQTQGSVRNVAPPIVSAIRSIPRPITTVTVNVSATHVTKSTTVQNRYGPGNGSSGQDSRPAGTGPLP